MDIERTGEAQKKRTRRIIWGAIALVAILLVTLGLGQLKPAAPTVDKATVWLDAVQRGPMQREVRGPGTLVAEDIRYIPAIVDGRIERIPALPGVTVTKDTLLVEMSNPDLEQNAAEAESQLKAAQADYQDLQAKLDKELLDQQSTAASVESQSEQAKLQAEADVKLAKDGLIPEITMKKSTMQSATLGKQSAFEKQKVRQNALSAQAQLAAQRARVNQAEAVYGLRRRQVENLHVKAGIDGVLQELPVQVGQKVAPGANLARVAQPDHLKAELKIPETQAKDVVIGQSAQIDTRNGIVSGHVSRVAPSVQDGTVTVDIKLDRGALPKGARVDLSVDGTILIERLDNVLYVGRPAYGQPNSKVQMFKLVDDGKEAVRVPVQLGRSSVNTIEIVGGLNVGDKVILSDTSAWDGHDRLRLN
ncbi:MAG TPA: efflux RND transporter periplasmic adaptor subunit [Thermoanaerobaculia bacterium]|jgi:HlyD family secretion protein|nr:efflux RND transporter periplasmic adaptor subunit [Thermoanaerobaculia bacterium]